MIVIIIIIIINKVLIEVTLNKVIAGALYTVSSLNAVRVQGIDIECITGPDHGPSGP